MIRTKPVILLITIIHAALAALTARAADNLLPNGSFADPQDALKGWVTDYAWSKNEHYIDNQRRVAVVPMEQGRSRVARLTSETDAGTKLETTPIPFEAGYRYAASLAFKGRDYRIYFTGYRWKPGIQPHANPTLAELRQVYKSRAATGGAPNNWQKVELELPGKDLTPAAKSYLKQIEYVTLFIYVTRTSYVDDVVLRRLPDASVRFD